MNIPILYEDDDVVVIDKPHGVMVHADGRSEGETIADWHVARLPQAAGVGESLVLSDGTIIDRPGVVHRLDRDTSGVLILARHAEAFAHLKAQFHDRHAHKEYRAFVYGRVKEEKGVIDRAIGRSAKDFRLRSAQRGARGTMRPATTTWQRLRATAAYSYLALLPHTGRTHQLRVHTKAINHPIVHDRLYASSHYARDPHALGFSRLALHAHTLSLLLPNGKQMRFAASLPEDFLRAEEMLRAAAD